MNFKNKFSFQTLSIFNLLCFRLKVYLFMIIYVSAVSSSKECVQINDCKCKFSNGSIIDLTRLGYHNEPRWKDIKPVKNESFVYSYNPCYKFSLGSNSECHNVAVCQRGVSDKNMEYDCGDSPNFLWNSANNTNILSYRSTHAGQSRDTNVTLVCSPAAWEPKLTVIGETQPGSREYEMILTTRCACADLCQESHLSAGSVLVIIFMIFVALYLVLGIIHSSLTRGAHGWELIPHYEFWVDLPLLIRDGCVFVISGCKPETAYERI